MVQPASSACATPGVNPSATPDAIPASKKDAKRLRFTTPIVSSVERGENSPYGRSVAKQACPSLQECRHGLPSHCRDQDAQLNVQSVQSQTPGLVPVNEHLHPPAHVILQPPSSARAAVGVAASATPHARNASRKLTLRLRFTMCCIDYLLVSS